MSVKLFLPWFLIFCVNFSCLHGQNFSIVTLGSSITAGTTNSSWKSPSGDFAFGFYSISGGMFLVGIWFDKIPERTLIWSANRDSPAEEGSTLQLTAGQLLLSYSNGQQQSINSGGASASSGLMQDDGNFVLRDGSSLIVWRSFDSPVDTLLPGQVLSSQQALHSNGKGKANYSTGNFQLQMQYDGNLVLSNSRFLEPGYWWTATTDTSSIAKNVSLVFNNQTAFMYLVNETGQIIFSLTRNIPNPVEDYYHRATIDSNGNFQQYVYHKRNGSRWTRVWRAVEDPCLATSVCGVNGMCTSMDNETINCSCIPGYTNLDSSNLNLGCHPEISVNYCLDPSMSNFTVQVIEDADFPSEDHGELAKIENVDVEGCKTAVMEDCYTLAASLEGSTCYKKRMPLLKAKRSASSIGIKALIKVPLNSTTGNPDGEKKKNFNIRLFLKISLIVIAILAFVLGASAIYYLPAFRILLRKSYLDLDAIGVGFREFTFEELYKATNGFSKTLGRGSSAKVYRGLLSLKGVHIEIAVKKLEKEIEKSENEFMTELKIIGRTHHRNLVRLLGFCIEKNQYLLVYELMANGPLSRSLFGEDERPNWFQRAEMALGVARGLLYLHEECETQIIHCDIKPQNVLLDENYTAKIADFGLSKLLNKDQTRTDTDVRGTMGYLAPEWLKHAPITAKVDVFSFGVMLLEIICCRRHIEVSRVEEESEADDLILSEWIISCIKSGKLETVVGHDPEVLSDFKRFERMAMVGLWCIYPDPILRPSIKKVMQMLEGTSEVGVPPLLHDHQL